jgi:hypothetical protein
MPQRRELAGRERVIDRFEHPERSVGSIAGHLSQRGRRNRSVSLPVCTECLVNDLAEVIQQISHALEAEQRGGTTTFLTNMQHAAQHLETPIQHGKRAFTW